MNARKSSLAAERLRAGQQARTVLEQAPQAALRPAQPLAPQRAERLDRLLVDLASGASVTWWPSADSRVESSRSSVRARSLQPPTASSASSAHEHAVPAQLGGAVGRPAAALAGDVHQLLLGLRRGSATRPMRSGARRADLERVGGRVAPPGAHGALEEVGLDARVGIDRRRSRRRDRYGVAKASTAPFVAGPVPGSRRRTWIVGQQSARRCARPRRCRRSSRRRRRGLRTPARPIGGSGAPRATATVVGDHASPRCARARSATRTAGLCQPGGLARPAAARVHHAAHGRGCRATPARRRTPSRARCRAAAPARRTARVIVTHATRTEDERGSRRRRP